MGIDQPQLHRPDAKQIAGEWKIMQKKTKKYFLIDHVLFFSLVSASIPGCIILFVLGCLEFFVCFGWVRFHKITIRTTHSFHVANIFYTVNLNLRAADLLQDFAGE